MKSLTLHTHGWLLQGELKGLLFFFNPIGHYTYQVISGQSSINECNSL